MRTVIAVIIGLVVMAVGGSVDAAVTLTLKDGVTVANDVVMLKDIAGIAMDARSASSLVLDEYVMCNAPRAGYTREVTKAYIIMKLRQQGIDAGMVHFAGADSVTVRRGDEVVSIDAQQKALHAWLCEQLSVPSGELKVVCKSVMRDVCVPKGEVEIVFSGDRATFVQRNAGVYAEYYVNGKFIVRKTMNFGVAFLRKIVMTNRAIARGEEIAAGDVTATRAFIDAFETDICPEADAVVGCVARHDIISGACLEATDIMQKEMVKRGDMVACCAMEGNMTLTAKVQACENGRRGETIKLLNTATNKTVSGRVIDEGKVALCV